MKNQGFEFEVDGKVLEAKLYNTGINEVLEKVTKDKANMLYTTEEIFRNARYLYSTADYDSDPNVYRWNYFYTPVQIGENVVGVRVAVRDVVQGQDHLPESQIYNWGIKKDASLGGVQPVVSDSSHDTSSDASNDIILQKEGNVKWSLSDPETDKAYGRKKIEYADLQSQIIDVAPQEQKKTLQQSKNSCKVIKDIYESLNDVEKQTLWRSVIKEIRVSGNQIKDIKFS